MSRYAKNTTVPIDRSKAEIERTLTRYGASAFGYYREEGSAVIAFQVHGRGVRMRLALPTAESVERDARGKLRKPAVIDKELDKAIRQRWRALALVIKAKLEAIEAGIATFETEWLAYLVTADKHGEQTTVGELVIPQLASGGPLRLTMKG